MRILDLTERIASEAELGVPVSIYRGGDRPDDDMIFNSRRPHVFITLADVGPNHLPADSGVYSWLDFGYDPEENVIHSPYIHLLPEHRGGAIAGKLNRIMEDVGRQLGCVSIRAYSIINEQLERLMPRFGYTSSGRDRRGPYVEKRL